MAPGRIASANFQAKELIMGIHIRKRVGAAVGMTAVSFLTGM
jgi:hypothetical protein